MSKSLTLAPILFLALAQSSCSKSSSASSEPLPKSDLSERFLLKSAPADAKAVLELRKTAHKDDQVVVQGRAKDFVDGLSVFTITDASLKPCNESGPMGDCPTPWDYCCDDQTEVAQATVTVEFRDGARPWKTGVRGFHGLDHLSRVVVTGKAEKDDLGNLSVLADGLFIQP